MSSAPSKLASLVNNARVWTLAGFLLLSVLAMQFVVQPSFAATPTVLTCDGRPATILGTDRGDNIVGTAGNDVIVALGGGDVIDGAGGDDFICGGGANDLIKGAAGQDTIDGGAGNDAIDAGDDADRCVLADRDSLSLCESTMRALTGAPDGPAPAAPTCNGKSATIVGTEMGDNITGTGGDDVIVALGGGDVIDAGGGNDTICSGTGRDVSTGGSGVDWIDGGEDGDHLIGGTEVDTLNGNDGDDVLEGQGGNDRLDGSAGRDALGGGPDNDLLVGGTGDDAVIGGAGDDVLDGGPGPGTDRDSTNGEDGNDACTTVAAPSTSQDCEGLAKLIDVTGGSITHGGTMMTVPAGLLTTPSYAAIRHELAGPRLTKTRLLGSLQFVDLFADWQGPGKSVTISMPFDATGAGLSDQTPAVYHFEDDGTTGVLKNIRLNEDRSRVEFETTALSAFTGAQCAKSMEDLVPGFCRDFHSQFQPTNTQGTVAARNSLALLAACGLGGIIALAEPTPFGEAAAYGGCLKGMVGEIVTPPTVPDPDRRALDCSIGIQSLAGGSLGPAFACASGVTQGEIPARLSTDGCNFINCSKMDIAVRQQREAAARARADREAAARAAMPRSKPVPITTRRPTGSNVNPQGNNVNPQGNNVNPQGNNVNPQGSNFNPQGSNFNPQG